MALTQLFTEVLGADLPTLPKAGISFEEDGWRPFKRGFEVYEELKNQTKSTTPFVSYQDSILSLVNVKK